MSGFRYRIVQILIAIAFAVIFLRLFQFQVLDYKKYSAIHKNKKSGIKIDIERGDIVDRNSRVLALDVDKYTLEYNPVKSDEDRNKLARDLDAIISFKNHDLIFKNSSQTLAYNLTKLQAQKIKALNSKLLYLRKVRSRFYPQDQMASHLIGFVDIYGKARQGLESTNEEFLLKNPQAKLELSIDSQLQVYVEKVLKQRVIETKSQRATAIVMKVNTGELLAWAISPGFNPNKYYNYSIQDIKNWSLVDVYQPGSIFKIVTVASALDSGTVSADHSFIDKGYLEVDKWKIKNHNYIKGKTKAEKLGLQSLFERSSNPFAAHLALLMGPEVFYKYIRRFNFGFKTGVELAGESKGILHKFNRWRKSDTATTGIGHGAISITPLQLIAGINAIANSGFWVRPTLLKQNISSNDTGIERKQVLYNDTAKLVTTMLADSIEHNITEKNSIAGRVAGLSVAGKTGTAEKLKAGGGYSKKNTVASFLGYFPAENPKYICLVVIDDPQTDGGWGDTVAGPVFNKIADQVKTLYL